MIDQVEIHRLLKYHIYILNDKEQAWGDLHGLTQVFHNFNLLIDFASNIGFHPAMRTNYHDYESDVRRILARALGTSYSHIPEECKKQASDDLKWLTHDEDT